MAKPFRDDDGMGEVWRAYRHQQQVRRAVRLPERQQEILALRAANFRVRQLTEYQFRIDERLDLYPIHRRYHDVQTNKRGTYQTAKAVAMLVCRQLAGKQPKGKRPA